MTFLEVASMVVTWWIVAFLPCANVLTTQNSNLLSFHRAAADTSPSPGASQRLFSQNKHWMSHEVRTMFIDYFVAKDHLYVPSSSVIPKKDEGSYFISTGINQVWSLIRWVQEQILNKYQILSETLLTCSTKTSETYVESGWSQDWKSAC